MISAFILLVILSPLAHPWNLAPLGLNGTFRIKHVSTYYIRAFLCIETPFSSQPTLVESFWPENFFALAPKVFPHLFAHAYARRSSKSDSCLLIQQAMLTQVDSLNRLWVLDKGSKACRPKIIVYDLIRDNVEVFRSDIQHFEGDEIITMKLGPIPTCCQAEEQAFFVLKDRPYLIAYDLLRHTWQKVSVISQQDENVQQSLAVHPQDIAFGYGTQLFIAEPSGKLFLANSRYNGTDMPAEYLGGLIGSPSAMIVDAVGTMYYLVSKFGAVIRCIPRRGLSTEGNEIISLSSLPINQIFFGVQDSVWLASETPIFAYDHCHRLVDSMRVAAVV